MNRRSVLAALAAGTATLAGCLGDGDDGNGDGDDGDGLTPEPTPTPTPTPTPERTVDVTVEAVTVAPAVVALNSPDSIGTFGSRDQQYVLAEITADSSELSPRDLQLVTGGERYSPAERVGDGPSIRPYGDLYFATEGESGWVAFELPKPLDAATAALSWPGGGSDIADPIVGALRRPPASFDVTVEAPGQVEADSEATLSVTVENTGDVPGTFVGALNRIGPSVAYAPVAAARLSLTAGETDTWEHSYEPEPGDAGSSFEFSFVWRDGDERREVGLVEPADDDGSGDDSSGSGSESGSA